MAARNDPISVVESCYDLGADETEWLERIADTMHGVLRPEYGILAYHIDVSGGAVRIREAAQSGSTPSDMVGRIRSIGAIIDRKHAGEAGLVDRIKSRVFERILRGFIAEPADRLVHSEHQRLGPDWVYTLGTPIEDTFALFNHHIDDNGLTGVFGGLATKRSFRPAERAMYQMLSAHIKAGLRLRRRLPKTERGIDAPDDGAVLTGSGRLLHAEGEATGDEAIRELGESARSIDRARSQKSGRDEHALAVWRGLVDGRWSLVESFDTDGKRFLLAHRNPEDVRDPRGLSTMESRVIGLVVRGYADKLVAYHLGISEGTVSSHLGRAMRKLGISSRVELVRTLGRRYPQQAI